METVPGLTSKLRSDTPRHPHSAAPNSILRHHGSSAIGHVVPPGEVRPLCATDDRPLPLNLRRQALTLGLTVVLSLVSIDAVHWVVFPLVVVGRINHARSTRVTLHLKRLAGGTFDIAIVLSYMFDERAKGHLRNVKAQVINNTPPILPSGDERHTLRALDDSGWRRRGG